MSTSKTKEAMIKATKNYLIELLEKEDWCNARWMGDVLKDLLDLGRPKQHDPTSPWLGSTMTGLTSSLYGGFK